MSVLNECQCGGCQKACTTKPGWFHPDQIAPLAAALGLSEQELFDQHLAVDWWDNWGEDGIDVFLLSPAIVGEFPGDMFPAEPGGRCAWFVDGKCQIHDKGKPAECAHFVHGMPHYVSQDYRRTLVEAWNTPEQQAQITKLLGREPVAGSWDPPVFGGMFGRF